MPRTSGSLDLASIQAALRTHRARASALQSRIDEIRTQIEDVEGEVQTLLSTGGRRAASGRGLRAASGRGLRAASGRGLRAASGNGRRRGRRHAARGAVRGMRRGAGRRPRNESLEAFLRKAMSGGKAMGIPELTVAVKRLGYASSSKNLSKIVGMRLSNRKQFKKVGRGQYKLG
ncbi:MAG TPA: hypothetical protein VKE69_12145 [Planctomycetota bacterium]|nr:hypothetical protein [Planctomycetota bacterium]